MVRLYQRLRTGARCSLDPRDGTFFWAEYFIFVANLCVCFFFNWSKQPMGRLKRFSICFSRDNIVLGLGKNKWGLLFSIQSFLKVCK